MSMHFLPEQTVTRNYEARLVVRGEDLTALLSIVRAFVEVVADPTDAEQEFVERVNEAVGVQPTTQQDPFAAHVAA